MFLHYGSWAFWVNYLILTMIYEVDIVIASFQIRNLRIKEFKYIIKKITL